MIKVILIQYPKYYIYIINYFISNKLRYFKDWALDLKIPLRISSNSIFERFNKIVKLEVKKENIIGLF